MIIYTPQFIIENLLDSRGKLSSARLKKFNVALPTEELYQIVHDLPGPQKCVVCGAPTHFKNFAQGYLLFCSTKCSANSPTTKGKKFATNMAKYGAGEAFNSTAARVKIQNETMEKFGVTHRSKLPETTEKRRKTCLTIYGVDNVNKVASIREKQRDTYRKKTGVNHPYQNKNLVEKMNQLKRDVWLPQKFQDLALHNLIPNFDTKNYDGVLGRYEWLCSTCSTKFTARLANGKIPRCPTCFPYGYNSSQLETDIADLIRGKGFEVITGDRRIICPLELDIVIPEKKVAIEIDGDYWHSELQGKDRNYHLNKTTLANNAGYRLIHILHSQWSKNPELVKSRITSALGVNAKVMARKCQVLKITSAVASNFLNLNHTQGNIAAKLSYGIYSFDHELIGVMTFGKSRFSKSAVWELLRYCSKQGVNITGGASKLYARFKEEFSPTTVISRCDLTANTGNLYSMLGFSKSHTSPPNYKYTRNYSDLIIRQEYQKHKLAKILETFDPSLTEWGNMQANGYDRIWDCGNSVWIWKQKAVESNTNSPYFDLK